MQFLPYKAVFFANCKLFLVAITSLSRVTYKRPHDERSSSDDIMPYVGRDWRCPGDKWVRTSTGGWKRANVGDGRRCPAPPNPDRDIDSGHGSSSNDDLQADNTLLHQRLQLSRKRSSSSQGSTDPCNLRESSQGSRRVQQSIIIPKSFQYHLVYC